MTVTAEQMAKASRDLLTGYQRGLPPDRWLATAQMPALAVAHREALATIAALAEELAAMRGANA